MGRLMRKHVLILTAIGMILVFLLATASGSTSVFARYYNALVWLNLIPLGGLVSLVALRLFQQQTGLPADGHPTAEAVRRLQQAVR